MGVEDWGKIKKQRLGFGCWGLDAVSLLEKLMDDVKVFVGEAQQHDDLTIIVGKVE